VNLDPDCAELTSLDWQKSACRSRINYKR